MQAFYCSTVFIAFTLFNSCALKSIFVHIIFFCIYKPIMMTTGDEISVSDLLVSFCNIHYLNVQIEHIIV